MAWTHQTITTFANSLGPAQRIDSNQIVVDDSLRNYIWARSIPLEAQGTMSAAIISVVDNKFTVTRQFSDLDAATQWKSFMDETYSSGTYAQEYSCIIEAL